MVAEVGFRRAMVERLAQKTIENAGMRRRSVKTIDPVIKMGRRLYPYLSERELQEYASCALRIILNNKDQVYQMVLATS